MSDTIEPLKLEHITLYTQPYCGFCVRVLKTLERMSLLDKIHCENISTNMYANEELLNEGGKTQVPAIKIAIPGSKNVWMYESLDIISFFQQNFGTA